MYDLTVTVAWKGHWVDDESKKVKAGAAIWWGPWLWDWLWKWLWPARLPAAQSAHRVRKGQGCSPQVLRPALFWLGCSFGAAAWHDVLP